jgi:hypothetical protein
VMSTSYQINLVFLIVHTQYLDLVCTLWQWGQIKNHPKVVFEHRDGLGR